MISHAQMSVARAIAGGWARGWVTRAGTLAAVTTAAWLLLLTTWTVGVISPGPDFIAVLRTAARAGRRPGIACAAGVVTGITLWIILAMTGISAVLLAHESVFRVVRIVGGVVLAGYGILILRGALRRRESLPDDDRELAAEPGPTGVRTPAVRPGAAFRLGLLTNVANPKALVFFGALFATILPAGVTTAERVVVLVVMASIALAWFVLVAVAAGSAPVVRAFERAERGVDAVLGSLFAALGVGVLVDAVR